MTGASRKITSTITHISSLHIRRAVGAVLCSILVSIAITGTIIYRYQGVQPITPRQETILKGLVILASTKKGRPADDVMATLFEATGARTLHALRRDDYETAEAVLLRANGLAD